MLKKIIRMLLIINIALFLYGLYLQYINHDPFYQKIMGIGVLVLVFILMPLFLYDRYKDKSLEDYRFKGFNQNKNTNESEK